MTARDECTRFLLEGQGAFEGLVPVVYDELKRLAGSYLRHERREHTLQPTALAHEAYLRLVDSTQVDWRSEAQFLAIAARAMRRVLIDHARSRGALKRGGGRARVTLNDQHGIPADAAIDVLDLHEQLEALAARDARKAQVAELRIFAGMSLAQIAEALALSTTTAEDDWYMARAWLRGRLSPEP
jgi:RNA polymerase sigma-70 factor (ECF subfamily)